MAIELDNDMALKVGEVGVVATDPVLSFKGIEDVEAFPEELEAIFDVGCWRFKVTHRMGISFSFTRWDCGRGDQMGSNSGE